MTQLWLVCEDWISSCDLHRFSSVKYEIFLYAHWRRCYHPSLSDTSTHWHLLHGQPAHICQLHVTCLSIYHILVKWHIYNQQLHARCPRHVAQYPWQWLATCLKFWNLLPVFALHHWCEYLQILWILTLLCVHSRNTCLYNCFVDVYVRNMVTELCAASLFCHYVLLYVLMKKMAVLPYILKFWPISADF